MIATRGRVWAWVAAAALAAIIGATVVRGTAREEEVIDVPDVEYQLPEPAPRVWMPAEDTANADRMNDLLVLPRGCGLGTCID